jgi:Rho GDP-dissociation inhibitor
MLPVICSAEPFVPCRVENQIVSGMKYLQVVKRAGMTGKWRKDNDGAFPNPGIRIVDKMEEMIGSYGPQKEAHVKIVSSDFK